jgi:hypothetical protein
MKNERELAYYILEGLLFGISISIVLLLIMYITN